MKHEILEVEISDIQIGDRHRKDMGDLEGLADSIQKDGLLQPIGITPDYELVFGERRLRAYRDLMRLETIPARIVDVESVLHGEFTEAFMRKDYTVSERVAIVEALRSFNHGGDRRSEQARNRDDEPLTVDQAAKRAGLGGKDGYSRAKKVLDNGTPELVEAVDEGHIAVSAAAELADAEPEEQRECLKRRFDAGKLTTRAVQKQLRRIRRRKDREELMARAVEAPQQDDNIQIHHCRFQELEDLVGLEPESVPLICTDIPYGNDFIDQIDELAAFAERVLVPGGTFVAYLGQHRLPDKLQRLDEHLTYQWMNTAVWEGPGNEVPRLKLVSKSIPMVVYSKGRWQQPNKWLDTFVTNIREKDCHPWQRPLEEVEKLIGYFSQPGDLVVDPCGGGFTTAIACLRKHRRFIGCDVDKSAVGKGQERLEQERRGPIVLPMKGSGPIATNSVVEGDCRELIPRIPDNSVSFVPTSPPYAEQRKGIYPGIPERQYADFTVEWMGQLWDKLTDDGSVMLILDPHVKDGELADYVLRTELALREFGWTQHIPQIWYKGDRCPLGRIDWPRHCYERMLWFSKGKNPFCDNKACGHPSERLGSPRYRHSRWSPGDGKRKKGIARTFDVVEVPDEECLVPDEIDSPEVFQVSSGKTSKGINHSAMFPVELIDRLIRTFCPPGGTTVFDPFAGSGNALIAAKQLGHPYIGFDVMPEYVKLAQDRLGDTEEGGRPPKAG